jgi:beta-glucosidase
MLDDIDRNAVVPAGQPGYDEVLAGLSTDEQAQLATGRDMWHTHHIERTGLGPLRLSDGPNGVRGTEFWINSSQHSACFPCGAALGASWDAALAEEIGAALGREAKHKGVHVLLGPTVNIPRLPIGGRNFECFSEDPFLSARLAVGYVRGVQGERIVAVIKHFVANDTERDRNSVSAVVEERTLREIYLLPFEAAVREAGVKGVMSAYNKINGTYAGEHAELLTGVLKQEWGFDGIVVSDWFGTPSTVGAARAGLDLEMPGPGNWFGAKLADAVRAGQVPADALADKARRFLSVSSWARADSRLGEPELSVDDPADRALARRAAAEATVLLQNRNGLLPLAAEKLASIALIGPGALALQPQGGGSAQVNLHPVRQLGETVAARAGEGVQVLTAPGCRINRRTPVLSEPDLVRMADGQPAVTVEYFSSADWSGEPVLRRHVQSMQLLAIGPPHEQLPNGFCARISATLVAASAGASRFSLASSSYARLTVDGETVLELPGGSGPDMFAMLAGGAEQVAEVEIKAGKPTAVEVLVRCPADTLFAALSAGYLAPEPDDLLDQAVALAAQADVAVVVVGRTPEWESETFDMESMSLPGRQDELIARVAAANPATIVVLNTGAPVAMPWLGAVRSVLQVWYPGEEGPAALADVIFGDSEPGGRLPVSYPARLEDSGASAGYPPADGEIVYGDGLLVGYRHHDAAGIDPVFCFGHGLSYTSFEYGALTADRSQDGRDVIASVEVANSGDRAGSEVVQLYVGHLEPAAPRPVMELKGFVKLRLEPGERQVARFVLDRRTFAGYSPDDQAWVVEPGNFELLAGSSSRDIHSRLTLHVD